jgi:hypothetical protein
MGEGHLSRHNICGDAQGRRHIWRPACCCCRCSGGESILGLLLWSLAEAMKLCKEQLRRLEFLLPILEIARFTLQHVLDSA